MLRRFFKYLLVGCSAMALLAGATQASTCDPNSGVDPDTWSLIEQWECEPGNPGVKAHKWACFDMDGTPQAIKYTDGVSDTDKCPLPSQPDIIAPAALAPQVSWECERAVAQGRNICDDNVIYCENSTDGSRNSMMVTKHSGVCNPNSGMRDSRGCIFQYQKDEQKPLFCSEREQAPAQGGAPAQAAAAQQVQCVVCDQGSYRLSVMCTNAPTCNINNPNQGPCVGAAVGQECPPRRPAPPAPPAAGGVSATGGSATGGSSSATGGSSTVTINNPATTTREVIRETTRVVTAGNVGVGTTVISGQVLGVKELPKTGLPALAWSALVFIPTGFGLRRFSKVKGDLQNHPSYIFDMRQFKAGS